VAGRGKKTHGSSQKQSGKTRGKVQVKVGRKIKFRDEFQTNGPGGHQQPLREKEKPSRKGKKNVGAPSGGGQKTNIMLKGRSEQKNRRGSREEKPGVEEKRNSVARPLFAKQKKKIIPGEKLHGKQKRYSNRKVSKGGPNLRFGFWGEQENVNHQGVGEDRRTKNEGAWEKSARKDGQPA